MTARCSWAACTEPSAHHDGEFHHCTDHWRMHLQFEREEQAPPPPPPPNADASRTRLEKVRDLVRCGYSTSGIARELDVSNWTARRLRQEAGCTGHRIAECGTRAGYARHKNHDEQPCQPCREAEQAYMREWNIRRRERRRAS